MDWKGKGMWQSKWVFGTLDLSLSLLYFSGCRCLCLCLCLSKYWKGKGMWQSRREADGRKVSDLIPVGKRFQLQLASIFEHSIWPELKIHMI